jgi:hypothetical protein
MSIIEHLEQEIHDLELERIALKEQIRIASHLPEGLEGILSVYSSSDSGIRYAGNLRVHSLEDFFSIFKSADDFHPATFTTYNKYPAIPYPGKNPPDSYESGQLKYEKTAQEEMAPFWFEDDGYNAKLVAGYVIDDKPYTVQLYGRFSGLQAMVAKQNYLGGWGYSRRGSSLHISEAMSPFVAATRLSIQTENSYKATFCFKDEIADPIEFIRNNFQGDQGA